MLLDGVGNDSGGRCVRGEKRSGPWPCGVVRARRRPDNQIPKQQLAASKQGKRASYLSLTLLHSLQTKAKSLHDMVRLEYIGTCISNLKAFFVRED